MYLELRKDGQSEEADEIIKVDTLYGAGKLAREHVSYPRGTGVLRDGSDIVFFYWDRAGDDVELFVDGSKAWLVLFCMCGTLEEGWVATRFRLGTACGDPQSGYVVSVEGAQDKERRFSNETDAVQYVKEEMTKGTSDV